MSEKDNRKTDALSQLGDSLKRVGEGLRRVSEKLTGDVAAGVDEASRWAAFTHAVSPLLESSPSGRMTGEEIETALSAEEGSDAVDEARERKSRFIDAHGQEAWNECIRESGTLRIERAGGRTRITKIDG